MKVLVNPEFNLKLSTIPQSSLLRLSAFVKESESMSKKEFLEKNKFSISSLDNNIYTAKIDSGRLYLTFGNDSQGDYLLLLDFSVIKSTPAIGDSFFTSKNPNSNSALNPKINSSINPKINSSINPKFNSSINPKLNSSINPKLNSSINPKLNSSINPRLNSSINPKLNPSLNPRFNRTYDGTYIYDLNLSQIAYVVKANEKIDLIFSLDTEFKSFLVHANDKIKINFNEDNIFSGYFVKANEQVWLWYSPASEWLGMLI